MSNTPFDPAENQQMHLAWQLLTETGANLFLTGKAGTGKTTFLRRLRDASDKRIVVVAPTGIAAVNAGGVTIHSFFQLPVGGGVGDEQVRRFDRFSRDKVRLIRSMDLLVIDEISMVRADLLDAVDTVLRRQRDPLRPFGGVQLLMIGDLQQLAPVVKDNEAAALRNLYDTPYFFSSRALRQLPYNVISLEHTYRQQDPEFLRLLNSIRSGSPDASVLAALNRRVRPGFNPPESEGYIRLVTHNSQAHDVNARQLAMLPGRTYSFKAEVEGDFPQGGCNAETTLLVKEGAQVMFLRNDPSKNIFNGMIGHVVSVNDSIISVRAVDSGEVIDVEPATWQNIKFTVDDRDGTIKENVTGQFKQFPLRLAWAITVHKSQGLTFRRAIIDVARSFAHGQTYVALSRCTSLDGMVLESPLTFSSIIYDSTVLNYLRECALRSVTPQSMAQFRRAHYAATLADAFGMGPLERSYGQLYRVVSEYLGRTLPKLTSRYSELSQVMQDRIAHVAETFVSRARARVSEIDDDAVENGSDPYLSQRIIDASRYFTDILQPFKELLDATPSTCDNKAGAKRLQEQRTQFHDALALTLAILEALGRGMAFTPGMYYRVKSHALADMGVTGQKKTAKTARKAEKKTAVRIADEDGNPDIQNPGLFEVLCTWRARKSQELGIPAYMIASTKALIAVANAAPSSTAQLKTLHGWGDKKTARFGTEILDLIATGDI